MVIQVRSVLKGQFVYLLVKIMAERAKRSSAWLHFTKVKDKEEAKCQLCSRVISCKGGNTSSMLKHLNVAHQLKTKCSTFACLQVGTASATPAVAGPSSSTEGIHGACSQNPVH